MDLRDKVAVITGCSGALGALLCEQLIRKGATVYGIDLKEKPSAGTTNQVRYLCGDISDPKAMKKIVSDILNQVGTIDLWINNAGITAIGTFLQMPEAKFADVLKINLDGTILGTRLALECMRAKDSGIIINLASASGHIPTPNMTAYSTSKHAVVGFTRSLRAELEFAGSAIRMVLVSPGFFRSSLICPSDSAVQFPKWLNWILSTPEQVSEQILRAIESGQNEIIPTWNGKAMIKAFQFLPNLTVKGSRVLLTNRFTDVLRGRFINPDSDRDAR